MLTVLDHFTKFAFAFPIRSHDAQTVAKYLVEKVFLTYGMPLQLLSDRGAEFEGSLMKDMCELLEIDKIRTTAYKPSTNGALERVHRTLNVMIGKSVNENQQNWDAHVAYVMASYNATTHSATGFTPNMLVNGRELSYPNKLMYMEMEDKQLDSKSYVEFVEKQRTTLRKAFALTREILGYSAERRKKRYDMRVRANDYAVGEWVYYFCLGNGWDCHLSGKSSIPDRSLSLLC